MNEPGFLVRVALGIGLAKRTVPAARMQSVNDTFEQGQAPQQIKRPQPQPAAASQTPHTAHAPQAPQVAHAAPAPARSQSGATALRGEHGSAARQAQPAAASNPRPAQTLPDGLPVHGKITDIGTVMPAAAQLTGDLEIEESIVLQCVVRGNVTQTGEHQVVLSATGGIHGVLRAHTAVIGGTVEGDVFADRVVLLETGVVHGNIEYSTLAIKEGATVNGMLIRVVPNVVAVDRDTQADTMRADVPGLRAVASAGDPQERVA